MTNSNGQGGSALLSLDERKAAARRWGRTALGHADPGCGGAVAVLLRQAIAPGRIVAGYYPLPHELDCCAQLRQIWTRAGGSACVMALPRTPARGLPLTFHRWGPEDGLLRERFGTMTSTGPPIEPDILLVPLLAFDRRGNRLGYGGGYYDRTIAARPGTWTIGCGCAALELAEVPTGPHDRVLDAIVTERDFITIRAHPCASSS